MLKIAAEARAEAMASVQEAINADIKQIASMINSAIKGGGFEIYYKMSSYSRVKTGVLEQLHAAGYTTEPSTLGPSVRISWEQGRAHGHH